MERTTIEYLNQIITLGDEMRQAQKGYFKDRTKENLIKSKQLEKEFDNAIYNLKQLTSI